VLAGTSAPHLVVEKRWTSATRLGGGDYVL
jgi:hypothetical protein